MLKTVAGIVTTISCSKISKRMSPRILHFMSTSASSKRKPRQKPAVRESEAQQRGSFPSSVSAGTKTFIRLNPNQIPSPSLGFVVAGSTGDQTQDLAHAKQMLYHPVTSSALVPAPSSYSTVGEIPAVPDKDQPSESSRAERS